MVQRDRKGWGCSHAKGTRLASGQGQAEARRLLERSKGTAFRLHLEPEGFLASLESCAGTRRNSVLAEASGPFVPAGGHACVCVCARTCPRRLGEPWSNRARSATGLPTCPAATLPPTQPPGCPQTHQGPAQRKVPRRRKVWDVQIPIETPGTQSCKDTAFLGYLKIYARSPGRSLELEGISGTWSQMDHLGGALKCRFPGPVR